MIHRNTKPCLNNLSDKLKSIEETYFEDICSNSILSSLITNSFSRLRIQITNVFRRLKFLNIFYTNYDHDDFWQLLLKREEGGMFGKGDFSIQKQEQLFVSIFQLQHRVAFQIKLFGLLAFFRVGRKYFTF